jgi:hypothetical protein
MKEICNEKIKVGFRDGLVVSDLMNDELAAGRRILNHTFSSRSKFVETKKYYK